ncbi:MAG: DUF2911 domain-containing protein [Flavobacteriaceae bacterium]
MKKILLLTFGLMLSPLAIAQVQTPQPSPAAMLKQTVGLTEVTVEYSRPGKRGRDIMGGLVPFGEMWRTGANKNTVISFSDEVEVGGQSLAAGTYAIFTRPGASMWEIFFYTDAENWGTPQKWDASKVAATVEAKVKKHTETMESFEIWISNLTNNGAHINIGWEDQWVSVDLQVPTQKKAMASIEKTLSGEPKANDYYSAASYYFQENIELDQAEAWISKAVEMRNDAYWYHRQHSLILNALGKNSAAIAAAKTSMELAEKAGNSSYVKMNKASIAEWSK